MRERGIEALLVTQRENVRYLTGFSGSAGCVIISEKRPVLITDFRYQLQARSEAPGTTLLVQKKDLLTAVEAAADDIGTKTLWFDETSLTVDRVKGIRKKGIRLKGVKDPVAHLRRCKDTDELSRIRRAIERAESSFQELRRNVKPGVSERELGLRLEWLMRGKGARRAAFDIIVASGRNGAMPHASISNRRLRTGDLVTFDFGAESDGYFCDITRTVCVGSPTPRQRLIHDLVLRAQRKAIDALQAGTPCAMVDKAARDVIHAAGQGGNFGHATGHGIGLLVHEAPSLSSLSKDRIETGMVVTVEPGVYIPGWGGVRIEDMVLITETGPRVMTSLPRDL
jgi:Xaa-Pro aminopeptidase